MTESNTAGEEQDLNHLSGADWYIMALREVQWTGKAPSI